jgi:hypothetical protein
MRGTAGIKSEMTGRVVGGVVAVTAKVAANLGELTMTPLCMNMAPVTGVAATTRCLAKTTDFRVVGDMIADYAYHAAEAAERAFFVRWQTPQVPVML